MLVTQGHKGHYVIFLSLSLSIYIYMHIQIHTHIYIYYMVVSVTLVFMHYAFIVRQSEECMTLGSHTLLCKSILYI